MWPLCINLSACPNSRYQALFSDFSNGPWIQGYYCISKCMTKVALQNIRKYAHIHLLKFITHGRIFRYYSIYMLQLNCWHTCCRAPLPVLDVDYAADALFHHPSLSLLSPAHSSWPPAALLIPPSHASFCKLPQSGASLPPTVWMMQVCQGRYPLVLPDVWWSLNTQLEYRKIVTHTMTQVEWTSKNL